MSSDQTIAFVLFAVVAAITPGPSNIILASTGARTGILRGLPCLFGVTAGMGLMMFLVAFGLGSLVLDNPTILHVLKWCGAGFLLWLAWNIATSSKSGSSTETRVGGIWYAAGFQWISPKSWLVCAGAVGTYVNAGDASAFAQSATFGILFVLAALPSCFVWLAFGASAQRLLRTERAARVFNVVMGLMLAGSVALFVG